MNVYSKSNSKLESYSFNPVAQGRTWGCNFTGL
jgi:hypothetical protein